MAPRTRFYAGLFCGAVLICVVAWGVAGWWTASFAQSSGTFNRDKAKVVALEKKLKEGAAKMFAAGASKRDVVKWATEMGGVGSQISDAAGISLTDLQQDNY